MFKPNNKILEKYANLLVNFALGSGQGVKKGEVVFLQVPECAKPLLLTLRRAVLKAGAHPVTEYLPDNYLSEFYEIANEDQINFFPKKYMRGKVEQMDHSVLIIAETNKYELKGMDPKKIMAKGLSMKPYLDWRNEKENRNRLTWTIAMYATSEMAKNANLSLKEYWEQIIKGCYLNNTNPVKKWKNMFSKIDSLKMKLNRLDIIKIRIQSKGTDLNIGLDKNRKWLGGNGRNIPSFEIFTSPDCRVTEGFISFNQPIYRYGNIIKNVKLEFKKGKVVKFSASHGENLLREMIKTKGANVIGEFSLTDNRFSKIEKFMGETLYDENIGGKYGNTHIALGAAYKDSFIGDPSKITEKRWREMGYNDSSVHIDIISTENRIVTATLQDNKRIVIYKNGKFVL